MSSTEIIEDIKKFPHYREFNCKVCGHRQEIFILIIQADCENCGKRTKLRSYAALGSEIEDVIDAVLDGLGDGSEFENAMKWKQVIDSYKDV